MNRPSTPLSLQLAALMLRLNGAHSPELERAVHMLCSALDAGHVCVPLTELDQNAERSLRSCAVVGDAGEFKPMILDAGMLYFERYWHHETGLAATLRTRASAQDLKIDEKLLADGLRKYLANADDAQRAAAENAVRRTFSVITGGPGTGKTRTATVVLALIATQLAAQKKTARFALAAPTGKAAARLKDSLSAVLDTLQVPDEVRKILPASASTLHRLLGGSSGSAEFRHNLSNPLPVDVLVVDEASMIDLPMMARLFAALRPDTQVLLLGDADQLASVEAGHVFGDICASGLAGVSQLVRNYRFSEKSSIHRLSQAIRAGNVDAALAELRTSSEDITASELPVSPALPARIVAGFRQYLTLTEPHAALDAFGKFRILCALRDGPSGVSHLNRLAMLALCDAGLLKNDSAYHKGMPLLVTRNDYQLRLFNGDIGLILPNEAGEMRAYFDEETGVRDILPARLPEHETAFAMTVHKAQGSEFDSILLMLPERDSPVLSRELLYTAITRAKTNAEIWWSEPALRAALARRAVRWSGLKARLA